MAVVNCDVAVLNCGVAVFNCDRQYVIVVRQYVIVVASRASPGCGQREGRSGEIDRQIDRQTERKHFITQG